MPVVGIDGKLVAQVNGGPEPSQSVVETLEGLLEMARLGEIRALGVAWVNIRREPVNNISIGPNEPYANDLMASICYLYHRYAAERNGLARNLAEPAG